MATTATATEATLVEYRAEDGLAIIELNDPPANTYTYEMNRQLDNAILDARMDDDVHVIILRGKGEKFFSAGANINMLREADATFKYYFCLHANETISRLEQTPKLVIAAVNGHCVGGGLEIALAADLRIARAGEHKAVEVEFAFDLQAYRGAFVGRETVRLRRVAQPARRRRERRHRRP